MTIIKKCRRAGGMVLDCGSGYKADTFQHVIQLDIAKFPSVDILAVNQRLPFVDGAFDAVFSLDVLEHVNDPFTCADEICRVLRPGGYLYIDLPFLQSEHGYPDHYFNATRSGLQRLFAELESLSHHVPASGRAIVALHSMLDIYRNGLPSDTQGLFLSMTVEEILARPPMDWVEHPIGSSLWPEYQWALACTTQALMRKPTGSSASRVTVSPDELPGFPEFRPPAKSDRRSTVRPSIRLARRVRRWLAALSSPRPIP